jgi:hypothetical protein
MFLGIGRIEKATRTASSSLESQQEGRVPTHEMFVHLHYLDSLPKRDDWYDKECREVFPI